MTDVLVPTEELIVNGVSLDTLTRDMAWAVDFQLIDGMRPFGPDAVPVPVREIHSGGTQYGFLVLTGLPGEISYFAVSELDGDTSWHYVGGKIRADEDQDLDDLLDAAGREVIADNLKRGHLAKAGQPA